ncbi:MAG: hypothetical protein IJT58_05335, partial [Synergistaceae bacterium]|nr:hypothetical protein [Synergistaceae bacterium]
CSFNNLTRLSLKDFASLQSLNCSSNKSMTSLNVEGCENLSSLTCNNCALEGTLDLTENTVLSRLTCSDNPNLTVKLANRADSIYDGYAGPTELMCNNINSVEPLDTTTLGAGLKWLWVSNQGSGGPATIDLTESSGVTSLYLNGNPNLTSLLLSSDTEAISTLDISGTKLEPQDIIDKVASGKGQPSTFKAASMVGGMTAGLTDLDVSAFTGLDELDLSGNDLTSVTLPASTTSIFGFGVNLANNKLKEVPAFPVTLTRLDLTSNDIGSLNVSSYENLEYLYAGHNNLKALDLSNNSSIIRLDVSYNKDLSDLKLAGAENFPKSGGRVDISGTKVQLDRVPESVFYLYADSMDESLNLEEVDLSKFTNAHVIHLSNNKNLKKVTLAPNEAGDSHEYRFNNCGLVSFDPPAGTCWISLENNQLATLDLSKATHLEEASVKGQTLIGAYVLTPEYVTVGGGSYSLGFDEIVGSSNVSKIANVTAYDDNGASVMVNSFTNGVAIFAEAPSKVTYNYMTGGKIAGTEISMDVTLATTDAIDEDGDWDGPIAPVLSIKSQTLNLTAGQKMDDLTISVQEFTGLGGDLSWLMSGDKLPDGLSGNAASDNRSYTITGTPAASTAGKTFECTVTAKNSAGSSSAKITFVIAEPGDWAGVIAPELSVQTQTLNLVPGQKMNDFTISVKEFTGFGPGIDWLTSGDLPSGLSGIESSDNRSFTITGTPAASTAGKTFNYTVTAKNSAGSSSAKITFVVASGSRDGDNLVGVIAPTLLVQSQTLNLTAGQEMTDFAIGIQDYTGIGGSIEWTTRGSLPSGLSGKAATDNRSYIISGTPAASTAGKTFDYSVMASNAAGSSSAQLTFVIESGNSRGGDGGSNQQTAESIKNMTPEQKQAFTTLELTGVIDDLPSLLEGFTNLENLDLSGAQIQHVALNENSSVKYISLRNNPYVKSLEINGNDTLEIIDFTGSSIETIDTDGCSKLKSIVVSDCTQLSSLSCVANALTVLDLDPEAENLPSLQLLSCDEQLQRDATLLEEMSFSDFTYEPFTLSEASSSGYDDDDDDEAEISWSFSNVQNLKAFDSSGKEIGAEYDSSTGKMTFAEAPYKIMYNYNTGFKNILMDVTISSESSSTLRSSSSGCNSGLGLTALFVLAGFVFGSALFTRKDSQLI